MSKDIEIIEVCPRDGFQCLDTVIPTETKLEIIEGLIACNIKHIECTSFVSPKVFPQLADAADITRILLSRHPKLDIFALIPNLHGAEMAYALGLRKVCYIVSLSETHNRVNVKKSHAQSLEAYKEIRFKFPDLDVELEIPTAFGCPFEGKFRDPARLIAFLCDFVDAGLCRCCLCDTIGIADPVQVIQVLASIKSAYPQLNVEVHFHDTRGLAMSNTLAAISFGIGGVQTSIGGLGGLPSMPGSYGNLSTEDLVWTLNEMGYSTEIDFDRLLRLAKELVLHISGNYSGHQIKTN